MESLSNVYRLRTPTGPASAAANPLIVLCNPISEIQGDSSTSKGSNVEPSRQPLLSPPPMLTLQADCRYDLK